MYLVVEIYSNHKYFDTGSKLKVLLTSDSFIVHREMPSLNELHAILVMGEKHKWTHNAQLHYWSMYANQLSINVGLCADKIVENALLVKLGSK